MSKHVKAVFWYTLIILGIVALDQLGKYLAVTYLMPVGDVPLIEGIFHLTYVENIGAAFGMLKDHRWVFMVISSVSIVAMYVFLAAYRKLHPLLGIAISFIAGGGIGNMIDRISLRYVVDFFYFKLINFAVFNIADSFISIGAGLMILYILLFELKNTKTVTTGS